MPEKQLKIRQLVIIFSCPYTHYKGKQGKIPLGRAQILNNTYDAGFSTRAPLLSTWKPSIVVLTAKAPDAFT